MNSIPVLEISLKGLNLSRHGAYGESNPRLRVRNAVISEVLSNADGKVLPALIRVTGALEVWEMWINYGVGFSGPIPKGWPSQGENKKTGFAERLWVFLASFGRRSAPSHYQIEEPFEGWHLWGTENISIVIPATKISFKET